MQTLISFDSLYFIYSETDKLIVSMEPILMGAVQAGGALDMSGLSSERVFSLSVAAVAPVKFVIYEVSFEVWRLRSDKKS